MVINFPSSPFVGQIYTYNGRSWEWNGTYWESYTFPSSGLTGATSVGVGDSVISGIVDNILELKSFSGDGITITDDGDTILLTSDNTGDYLPLSGGTVTGVTNFTDVVYVDNDIVVTTDIYGDSINVVTYYNLPVSAVTNGAGISASTSNGTVTVTNTAPDQTVTITGGTNIQIAGTYPNFGVDFTGTTGGGDYLPLSGGTVTGNTTFTSGLTVNYIDFDTTPNVPAPTGGTLYFDATENALSYKPITPSNDVTVNLGQESLIRIYNDLGFQINNGQALHITGSTSGSPTVSLAIGTGGDEVQFQISGIATQDIPNSSFGFMTYFGIVRDINLTGFTVGEQIYLSQTVPGGFSSYSGLSFTGRTCEVGHILDNSALGKIQVSILNEIEGTIITTQENNILAANNSSTGVFQFSGLSITTPSGTTFNVGAVEGWIIDNTTSPTNPTIKLIIYSGATGITATNVTSATETYILLTSGLTITQQTTFPTPQQRRQNLYLGKFGHGNKQFLINAFNEPDSSLSPVSQLRDMFTVIKLVNDGVIASANGANLNINTSAGVLYGLGIGYVTNKLNPNSLTVNGQSPATFQYRTQTGGTAVNTTLIDPLNRDVNGVITPITGTKATNQRIYLLQNGQIRVQYGQQEYNQLAAAVAALQNEVFVTFPNFRDNGILIGVLSILSTCTQLNDTTKAQFFSVSKFGELIGAAGGTSTTTLQQAYNNSSEPEILINSTLDGLSIRNGTGNADNVTQLLQGQNSGGTVTSFIRADGAFSGTSIFGTGLTASTISATSVTITPPTDTSAIVSTGYSVTGSGTTAMLRFNGSVNTTGNVIPYSFDVTNTASGSGSFLVRFSRNGSYVWGIGLNDGQIYSTNHVSITGSWQIFARENAINGVGIRGGAASTHTSGSRNHLFVQESFAPTAGTGTYTSILSNPTINQTGGSSGITRGLYVNPIIAAAADWRAIETSIGNVMLNTVSGNTLIGTTTNSGFKLDVSGTTRITGGLTATTISATTYENLPSAFQSVRISGTTQFSANTGTFVNFSGVNISITSASTNTLVFSGSPQFTVPGLNNQVLTSNGSGGAVAETILTFDGGATSPTLNVNGVCVGRGNGNTPSNISIGNTSFCSLSFGGVNNVSIGYGSTLTKNTIGNQNIGIGRDVLSQNNTGCYNIGIGGSSLTSNINGCSNIGVGSSSLQGLSSGSGNIGIGVSALQACCGGNFSSNIALGNLSQLCRTSGDNNISLGNNSQRYSTGTTRNISMGVSSLLVNQGSDNVSLGYKTLFNNVNGNKNIAIGNYSLCGNVGGCCACGSGNSNIAIGYDSLRNNSSFSDHNIAIGQSALYYNTNAASNPNKPDFNIAIGRCSMLNNNDGYENIAIGRRALMSNTGAYSNRGCGNLALGRGTMANNYTGCYNIALGRSSLYNNTTGYHNIALGRNSGGEITTGYRNISLGDNSLYYTTTGNYNISLGHCSLYYNTEGNRNIAIGVNSIRKSTGSTDNIAIGTLTLNNWGGGKDPNIAIGTNALHGSTTNSGAPYYTTNYAKFTSNIAIGTGSQYCNYSGNDNVSLGKNTLNYNLNGNKNIAIGYYALSRANGGNYNIAIGTCSIGFAGPSPVGNFNIAIGYSSFGRTSCSGNHNILLGYKSMYATYGGSHNIGMGYRVLYSNCGGSNVAFGYRAMEQNVTGYNNIALGYKAMCSNTVGYRNVAIGYCVSSGNYSNSIILGGYATATGNCQFVVGSSTIPIGTITTETCTSSKTWEIRINGNTYKVLLV